MDHKQAALGYFRSGMHCSQAVLAAFAEECGITEDQALRLGSCFGSGMRKGQVCGACTGGLMALGLMYGFTDRGSEDKIRADRVNDMMMDRFAESCGSCICNEILGCDISTAEGVRHALDSRLFTELCPKMVAAAVDTVEGIVREMEASGVSQATAVPPVTIEPLESSDREQFVRDNQEAFRYGATEEFGLRDDHFEEPGEIISRETIEKSIDSGDAYRIMLGGRPVGGAVVSVKGSRGDLQLLFVSPGEHSKGIGYQAWQAIERQYPQVRVWETCTPYFEKRNIHFYVNRCGFHITEYFHGRHRDPNSPDENDEMFHFEKVMF